MGGDKTTLQPLAAQWAAKLPETAFVLFDSTPFGTVGDWYRFPVGPYEAPEELYPDGAFGGNFEAYELHAYEYSSETWSCPNSREHSSEDRTIPKTSIKKRVG